MVHIHDIIPEDLLERELANKTVARKTSPDGSKHLYCYTKDAQYKNHWNAATINSRGLVTDAATGTVLARPLPKFFNYGDPTAGTLDLDAPVEASDKLDGSLAILLPDGTLASKGSFTSFVAEHATKRYQDAYADAWTPDPSLTYVFEAIFPEGRIVLDYGKTDDLFLLGAIETETGHQVSVNEIENWPGCKTETFPARTLREVLELPPRENAEGLVVTFLDGTDRKVKVKQDDYKQLHAIVTNTSAITLWEALSINDLVPHGAKVKDLAKMIGVGPDRAKRSIDLGEDWEVALSDGVPDEFHQWMKDTLSGLRSQFDEFEASLLDYAKTAKSWGIESRGDFVAKLRAQDYDVPWNNVLSVHDAGATELPVHVRAWIWKTIRPVGGNSIGWGLSGDE